MSTEKRGTTPLPDSLKSDGEPLDVAWDDDTLPGFGGGESIFDRVTEIPDIPLELQAKQMMAAAAAEEDPISGTFERGLPELPPDSALTLDLQALSSLPPPEGGAKETDPSRLSLELTSEPGPETDKAPAPSELELELEGTRPSVELSLREIKDRYAMGDYSGALVTAESILEVEPDQPDATRYANRCRQVLMDMYGARIGQLSQVASVAVPPDQIRWLSLDHRAGFLLSLIDGHSTLDEVLDISGMPRLDALRILFSLIEERVIQLAAKSP
jgi:hypothetical protein